MTVAGAITLFVMGLLLEAVFTIESHNMKRPITKRWPRYTDKICIWMTTTGTILMFMGVFHLGGHYA